MARILGISAFYHDSAAALVIDGKIVAAAQEERFTRIKHTPVFPSNAIKYCLEYSGLEIDDLDAVVYYDKPLLKFERLLETYYAFSPKGLISFLKAIPVWVKEKLFLKNLILKGLKEVGTYDKKKLKLLTPEHHLSHSASAFYPSSFASAAILTVDGVGEWCTASISFGEGNKIKVLKELNFPHSVGLFYSAFTYYLGFRVNSGEYKLMGLAPYGNAYASETIDFIKVIKANLIDVKHDGSIWLDQSFFNYAVGLRMVKDKKWEKLFNFPKRKPEADIEQYHCNLALAVQIVTEEIVIKMAQEAKRITNSENICMAGGVALNCVANGKLLKEKIFKNIYIQPASGDAGGALGAALAANYMYFDETRLVDNGYDQMQGAFLGPEYFANEIESMSRKFKAVHKKYAVFHDLVSQISTKILEGNVIGWFQGRMEFGPRALGNRSILADPRDPEMQKKLNLTIKYREGFRPFAPSVLSECANDYFDLDIASPYMLFVSEVKAKLRNKLPENFESLGLWNRLYFKRSSIPSITHLDFSARVQTVHKETNPKFWELINEFKHQTGCGLLINTSFNVRGEPMVCTPYDAYRCFMNTDMDYLVINDFVFSKADQPDWKNKKRWQVDFEYD